MSEPSTSTISTKKVTSSVAGYIWDSPCLKPLVFNPFLVSAVILLAIWAIDLLYGKGFKKGSVAFDTAYDHNIHRRSIGCCFEQYFN